MLGRLIVPPGNSATPATAELIRPKLIRLETYDTDDESSDEQPTPAAVSNPVWDIPEAEWEQPSQFVWPEMPSSFVWPADSAIWPEMPADSASPFVWPADSDSASPFVWPADSASPFVWPADSASTNSPFVWPEMPSFTGSPWPEMPSPFVWPEADCTVWPEMPSTSPFQKRKAAYFFYLADRIHGLCETTGATLPAYYFDNYEEELGELGEIDEAKGLEDMSESLVDTDEDEANDYEDEEADEEANDYEDEEANDYEDEEKADWTRGISLSFAELCENLKASFSL